MDNNLQLDFLKEDFNKLQNIYWDKNLDPIYWWWEIKNPDICLVFMNPTWKNVSSNKNWKWIKAPWIWTKNVWKMFFWLWFIDEELYNKLFEKNQMNGQRILHLKFILISKINQFILQICQNLHKLMQDL